MKAILIFIVYIVVGIFYIKTLVKYKKIKTPTKNFDSFFLILLYPGIAFMMLGDFLDSIPDRWNSRDDNLLTRFINGK